MSGSTGRAAAGDYSRGSRGAEGRSRGPESGARSGIALALLGVLGALALLAATALPVVSYALPPGVDGFDDAVSGWQRSGPLLPAAGLAALVLAPRAWRGRDVRAVAAGWLLAGVVVLAVALSRDAGRLDEVVTIGIGSTAGESSAVAGAGAGWYAETGGAVALLLAGGLLLILARGGRGRPAPGPVRGTRAGA